MISGQNQLSNAARAGEGHLAKCVRARQIEVYPVRHSLKQPSIVDLMKSSTLE